MTLAGGGVLELDLSDWIQRLYYLRETEDQKLALMRSLLPPDGVFVDIGANVGLFTVAMASRLENGRVWAYEPVPENVRKLQNNVRINGFTNVRVRPVAVGDRVDSVQLRVPPDHSPGSTSSIAEIAGRPNWVPVGPPVEQVTLDTDFKLDRLELIKIDVQGQEYAVLDGASEVIRRFRPRIIVEMGSAAESVRDWASENGYAVELVDLDAMLIPEYRS